MSNEIEVIPADREEGNGKRGGDERGDYRDADRDADQGCYRDDYRSAGPRDPLAGPRAWAHVMYGLHALSAITGVLTSATIVGAFVFGWPSIIAVIINYLTRDQVRGSWLDSHWRWQLRSFWYAALWLAVAGLLIITLIGIPFAFLVFVGVGCWVLYRVARGWLALLDGRGMPS